MRRPIKPEWLLRLARETAGEGRGQPRTAQAFSRYVSHTAIKKVSEWVSGSPPPVHLQTIVDRLRASSSLVSVASAFTKLHEQREAADYDHSADFTRPGTLTHVRRAEQAVAAIRATTTNDDFRALYGLITLQTSMRSA